MNVELVTRVGNLEASGLRAMDRMIHIARGLPSLALSCDLMADTPLIFIMIRLVGLQCSSQGRIVLGTNYCPSHASND